MRSTDVRWTQDEWGDNNAPVEPSPLRRLIERHGWLLRGVILLLALLIFELTANATISAAMSCLEIGRTDVGLVRWLWGVDPDRRRGRLTALCYLAGAFCRVGVLALVAILLDTLIGGIIPAWLLGNLAARHLGGAVTLLLGVFAVGALISFWVSLAALLSGRRIWLGPEPRLARDQGIWPPSRVVRASTLDPTNQAQGLFHLACVFTGVLTSFFLGFACRLIPDPVVSQALIGASIIIGVGVMLLLPILESRILARTPADCWPLDEPVTTRAAPGSS